MKSLLLALALVACAKDSPEQTQQQHPAAAQKDPTAAKKLIADGATVIDVRSPEEFESGHLPQATNIPIDQFAQRLAEVGDKSKPVVVHCAKGGRAAKAKAQLEAAGYTNVVNGGGYDDLR